MVLFLIHDRTHVENVSQFPLVWLIGGRSKSQVVSGGIPTMGLIAQWHANKNAHPIIFEPRIIEHDNCRRHSHSPTHSSSCSNSKSSKQKTQATCRPTSNKRVRISLAARAIFHLKEGPIAVLILTRRKLLSKHVTAIRRNPEYTLPS